jgi:hypothetical protein
MIHYTKEYIGKLLDKYMDGTTTLEEEDALSRYFRGKDIPQEWENYRQLFQEIEAMKPKTNRRWIGWGVAAAIVAGILYLAMPSVHREDPNPLVAAADTTATQQSEAAPVDLLPDSAPKPVEQIPPIQTKKRGMRKPEPTIHDYDKAYALMAEAEQERMEAERQIEQAQQEIVEARLAAYGYVPVMQEDGTILYINEQTNYIAYEE